MATISDTKTAPLAEGGPVCPGAIHASGMIPANEIQADERGLA